MCRSILLLLVVVVVVAAAAVAAQSNTTGCLGEFQECPNQSCVLFAADCSNQCSAQEYLCPDHKTCVAGASWLSCPGLSGTIYDTSLSADQRIAALLSVLTVTDKIKQLTNRAPDVPYAYLPQYNYLNDDEHGVLQHMATSFPNGNALGATWDADLLYRVGKATGIEARGIHNGAVHSGNRASNINGLGITLYAPNLNLVRNPLWGRAQEVYSEDPRLTGELTRNFVTGIQGDVSSSQYMIAGACCKHFAAYDLESVPTTRYNFSANVDVRNMWETYMPAFEQCVAAAKGSHVMCSYNSINGIPTCADPNLLNGILRKRWNFDGFVVSDYDAWANLVSTHDYCPDMVCAATKGLLAGMDQEGGGTQAINALPQALQQGQVTEADIDQALARLMRVRIRLGMFDPPLQVPFNYIGNGSDTVSSAAHIALAREAAVKAMTLYKNKNAAGAAVLPLAPQQLRKLVLIGPQMNMTTLLQGNYAVSPNAGIVTVLQGFQNALKNTSTQVVYEPGCLDVACVIPLGFSAAINACKGADHVIIALGLDQMIESEGHDRTSLDLPAGQTKLVNAIRQHYGSSINITGVLIHGGTLALHGLVDQLDAILDAWYPSMQGGNAIADVVLGAVSPAGRAAVTSYQSTSQLPPMGQMDLYAGNGITYRYFTLEPQFPFGFGLSYTTFSYTLLSVGPSAELPSAIASSRSNSKSRPSATATRVRSASKRATTAMSIERDTVINIGPCDNLQVTFSVANTGSYASDEVSQLYVAQLNSTDKEILGLPQSYRQSSFPTPNIRLADFTRTNYQIQSSQTLTLFLTPEYRATVQGNATSDIYNPTIVAEEGYFKITVGGGQNLPTNIITYIYVSSSAPLSQCQ